MVFGEGWHTDSPFLPEPPSITMLYSVQVPPFGGDTTWANAALAYSMLSDTYRRMIEGLKVHFSMRDVLKSAQEAVEVSDSPIGRLAATRDVRAALGRSAAQDPRQRPSDGAHASGDGREGPVHRSVLWRSASKAWLPEESAPILHFLTEHITQPAFTCRLRWEADMLVIWDNRLCVHQAYNDYQGYRREMYRTTVARRPAGLRPQRASCSHFPSAAQRP